MISDFVEVVKKMEGEIEKELEDKVGG